MKRRVVNYGCSHAFGAELAGRGLNYHPDNIQLNFGNLVAQHFDCDFKIAARPGNSNKQMLHDIIEFVQPGDICLLSWTYADRDRLIVPENTNPHGNVNYTTFHTLSVLTKNSYRDSSKTFMERYFPSEDQKDRERIESSHYFIQNLTDPFIKSVSQAHYDYYSKPGIQTLNFLEIYKCANEIIKNRGAIAVNFHFDMESEILIYLKFHEEMDTKFLQCKLGYHKFHNELSPEMQEFFLTHPTDTGNSELYRFYRDDTSRINWTKGETVSPFKRETNPQPYSFKQWYMKRNYNNRHIWPGNRLGHLDADGHRVLSEFIIEKLEKMLNADRN